MDEYNTEDGSGWAETEFPWGQSKSCTITLPIPSGNIQHRQVVVGDMLSHVRIQGRVILKWIRAKNNLLQILLPLDLLTSNSKSGMFNSVVTTENESTNFPFHYKLEIVDNAVLPESQ